MKNTVRWLVMVLGMALLLCLGLAGAASAQDVITSAAMQSEVAGINSAIATSGAKWQAGETSMTSLTPAERMMRLGIIDPPLPVQQRTSAPSLSQAPPLSIPSSLDWRSNGGNFVTGIRNQGNCGGCWAFGSIAGLESKTLISNNTPGTDLNLSEQVVISCSGGGSCNGGYLVDDFFVNSGAPLETCYPFTQTNGNCSTACANWQSTAYHTNKYTWVVPYGSQQTADSLKNGLYTYGPIVVTFAVYADFYSYSSGIYSHTTGTFQGYHAVLLVGYDDVNSCFIVKNSWGTGWGEAGFFRIAYSELTGVSDFGYEALAYGDAIVHDTSPWTRQLGTASDDAARAVAVDASGNVYVAGETLGGLDNNTSAGGGDLFVVKYDNSGAKQWTRQLGTAAEDTANAVAVDTSGNVYAAGYTNGGLDGNTNAGSCDLFVVKYNSSGVKQWTRQMGTVNQDEAYGVAVDGSGNVYVTGETDAGLDGNTSAGGIDAFVVKYNSSGVKQWTKQMGTTGNDGAYGVAVDTSGNVYVAGWTPAGLDGNTYAGGPADLFVVKYNSSGAKQWTRQLGTANQDVATGVATDGNGNVYVAGWTGNISTAPGDPGLDGNLSAGVYDLFIVKYNSSGTKQWTKQMGTTNNDSAYGVAVDSGGNVYVAGSTNGGLDGNSSTGSFDAFVVKYNTAGVKQWTKQMGTALDDWAYGVAVDGNGSVYAAGYTNGDIAGTGNAGGYDLFAMKLAQPVASATLTASSSSLYTGNTVTFTATAIGGTGSPEYLFWLYGPGTGNTWVQKAAYSSSSTWSFTPSTSDAGTNYVMAYVRASGSSAWYEAYAMCSFTVNLAVAPKSVTLMGSSAMAAVGAPMAFLATASGGTGPYEYSFWLYGPGTHGTWVQKAAYSTSRILYWTPSSSDIGSNYICVWVRNVGSPASYETYAYSLITAKAAVAPTSATLMSSATSVTRGTMVSFKASAAGGTGPYEYSYWVYGPANGYNWVQKTSYSTNNIWYWTPSSSDVGSVAVCVWVRNMGSSASYETYAYSWLTVK